MVRPANHLCIALATCEELTQKISFGLQPMGDKLVFCPFKCWDAASSMPLRKNSMMFLHLPNLNGC